MGIEEVRAPGVERGVTLRSVLLGLCIVILLDAWITYSRYILHASALNITHFSMGLFIVILMLAPLNTVLRRIGPKAALSPSEFLVITAMGLVGAMLPSRGLMGTFIGMLASPYYRASPENQWADYLHAYIPSWMVPSDSHHAMRWLFEGLPEGERIPWEAWVVPLFWWLSVIGAIFFVLLSIMVILRKQWVEHERLIYPLLGPAIDMASESGPNARGGLPGFMRNRLFWAGVALPFGIISWNMISYFSPGFSRINLSPNQGLFYFARHFPPLLTHLNFYTMGFGYFVNLDVLFSIWFFHLVLMTEIAMFRRVGFAFSGTHKAGGGWGDPIIQWQCAGAFVLFVLWGLWMARRHIRDVGRKAFWGDASVDDRNELLSYRTAVFGLIIGSVFVIGWLKASGMEFKMTFLLFPALIIICIGMAKIVAESGTLYLSAPMGAQDFSLQLLGADALRPSSILSTTFFSSLRWNLYAPALGQSAKLADVARGNKRRIGLAIILAVVVGVGTTLGLALYYGYRHGAYNFVDFPFTRYAPGRLSGAVSLIKNPFDTCWERIFFFGIGAAVISVLTLLRYRLPWWPLHPVGFIITTTSILHVITSIFIVWVVKSIVLRIGGVALYRRTQPFFLGLISGKALGLLVSFIVDLIWFPGAGHGVHAWV